MAQRKITFSYLRRFNGVMAGLHFVQGMLMLVTGLVITNIKEFTLPVSYYFQSFDTEKMRLFVDSEIIGSIPIGVVVSVYLFLSAIALSLIHISEPTRRTPISYAV